MELPKEAFERLVADADARLASLNTPIPGRSLQAAIAIFRTYKVSGPLIDPFSKDISFPVTANNLSNHVQAWYQDKYGKKTHIDPSPGRFPVLIEGAVYQCRLPLAYGGQFHVVGSKGSFADKRILNAVEFVSDLPKGVRARLSNSIEGLLQVMFITCLEVARELHTRKSPLCKSAESDILISCDLLASHHVNTSLSAWHSLQFAEKILKEYISRFEEPLRIHNVKRLSEIAASHGYSPDNRIDWGLFNFGATVRYGSDQLAIDQACAINHEAWRIAYNVLKQL